MWLFLTERSWFRFAARQCVGRALRYGALHRAGLEKALAAARSRLEHCSRAPAAAAFRAPLRKRASSRGRRSRRRRESATWQAGVLTAGRGHRAYQAMLESRSSDLLTVGLERMS